jgi:hypothetical protein
VMWEGLGVLLLAMVVRVCRLERLGGMGNSINELRARTADADIRISATSYIEAKGHWRMHLTLELEDLVEVSGTRHRPAKKTREGYLVHSNEARCRL